jgi:hypothetical protein
VGLTGAAYRNPVAMNSGFGVAMVVCACLLAAAAVLSAATIDNNVLRAEPAQPMREPRGPGLLSGRRAAARTR